MTRNKSIGFAALAAVFAASAALAPASAGEGRPLFAMLFQPDDDPFASLVGKRRERAAARAERPAIERYVTASGDREFLLEVQGERARIKFLCAENDTRIDCRIAPQGGAEEVIPLTASRGSRGDLLFEDAAGEVVLKIAAHGGATVQWPGEAATRGALKTYTDETGPLGLAPARLGHAYRRAQGAAAHLSALTGSPIVFDIGAAPAAPPAIAAAPGLSSSFARGDGFAVAGETMEESREAALDVEDDLPRAPDATVLADAVARVAGGMHRVAGDPTGARVIGARIAAVRFLPAAEPALHLDGAVLNVFYNPQAGLAGRPSSAMVAKYLEESL